MRIGVIRTGIRWHIPSHFWPIAVESWDLAVHWRNFLNLSVRHATSIFWELGVGLQMAPLRSFALVQQRARALLAVTQTVEGNRPVCPEPIIRVLRILAARHTDWNRFTNSHTAESLLSGLEGVALREAEIYRWAAIRNQDCIGFSVRRMRRRALAFDHFAKDIKDVRVYTHVVREEYPGFTPAQYLERALARLQKTLERV